MPAFARAFVAVAFMMITGGTDQAYAGAELLIMRFMPRIFHVIYISSQSHKNIDPQTGSKSLYSAGKSSHEAYYG